MSVRRLLTAATTVAAALAATAFGASADALSPPAPPSLEVGPRHNAGQADVLLVRASRYAAGGTVDLFRTASPGRLRVLLATETLGEHGNARFRVKDRNGAAPTEYRVVLRAAEDEYPRGVSPKRRAR